MIPFTWKVPNPLGGSPQACPQQSVHPAGLTMSSPLLKALQWPQWFQDKVQAWSLRPLVWSLTQELTPVGTPAPLSPESSLLCPPYWIIPIHLQHAVLSPTLKMHLLLILGISSCSISVFLNGSKPLYNAYSKGDEKWVSGITTVLIA